MRGPTARAVFVDHAVVRPEPPACAHAGFTPFATRCALTCSGAAHGPATDPDLDPARRTAAHLDPASREEVLHAIRSYTGAIILVTHDEGAVRALDPDRVLLLPQIAQCLVLYSVTKIPDGA